MQDSAVSQSQNSRLKMPQLSRVPCIVVLTLMLGGFLSSTTKAQEQPAHSAQQVAEIVKWWTGEYDNRRQVDLHRASGLAGAPEFTVSLRRFRVHRIDSPAIGPNVLFLQEFEGDSTMQAYRQRVVSLEWDARANAIRGRQLFFLDGPAYGAKTRTVDEVASMKRGDFRSSPGCDLYFRFDEGNGRYRGSMAAKACSYEHEVEKVMVYVEYDMLLRPNQFWYRDRTRRLLDSSIRVELDGFSYVRFERP